MLFFFIILFIEHFKILSYLIISSSIQCFLFFMHVKNANFVLRIENLQLYFYLNFKFIFRVINVSKLTFCVFVYPFSDTIVYVVVENECHTLPLTSQYFEAILAIGMTKDQFDWSFLSLLTPENRHIGEIIELRPISVFHGRHIIWITKEQYDKQFGDEL